MITQAYKLALLSMELQDCEGECANKALKDSTTDHALEKVLKSIVPEHFQESDVNGDTVESDDIFDALYGDESDY